MVGDEAAGDGGEDERQWRFGVDEVGEDADGEGVAGSWAPSTAIEPERIDPENAAFVLLGVLLGVAVIALLVF